MPAATIERVRLTEERHIGDARRALRERPDDDVALAVGNRPLEVVRRAEQEVDGDVLGALHEAADRGLQAELGTGHDAVDDADAEPADELAALLADALVERVEIGEELPGRLVGRLAEGGEAEAAATALAEPAAELPLERGEMGRKRRGRKVERELGLGEAPASTRRRRREAGGGRCCPDGASLPVGSLLRRQSPNGQLGRRIRSPGLARRIDC